MEAGLVSIITPAFNSAALIGETIRSVLTQTYPHWEMLVVLDSGTVDHTADIVSRFSARDPRIKLIQITDGRGISLSRNKALELARGEFVAFLDSDDLWLPQKLEKQISFMRAENSVFSCSGYRKISQDASKIGMLRLPPLTQNHHTLLLDSLIPCPTVMFNQSVLGKFKMAEHPHEDYILWLEIIKKAKVCKGLQEDLARYRIVENSRSMNVNRSASRWLVYRNFEKLSRARSSFYFINYGIHALTKRLLF